ncbi:MAG: ABC transporter permease [Akkermansiaceae bacterium]
MEIGRSALSGLAFKLLAFVLAAAVLIPLGVVFLRAIEPAGDAWSAVVEYRLWGYVWQTLLLVALVVFIALAAGVPTAWLVSAYEFRGRAILDWVLLLPMAMPGFVAAAAYVDLLGDLIPFYVWVRTEWGIDAFLRVQKFAPWFFATGILGLTLFPYVYLSCRAVFARQSALAIEAARLLGESGFGVFFRVALPMARPAIVAGASLVVMESMNDYGVVSLFGLVPLTPGVFRAWGEGEVVVAMRLALFLMFFLSIVLVAERWQRGRRSFGESEGGGKLRRVRLGWVKAFAAVLACLFPVVLGFFLPVWRLVRWCWESRGTDWFAGHSEAAWNSFSLAGGTVILLLIGAMVLVAVQRAYGSRMILVAQKICLFGYGLPSALVAVGVGALVVFLAKVIPGGALLALSASVFGLVLAYFVRFLAVAIQPLLAGFERVPGGLNEAARTLGSGRLGALWRVDLPLVRPAILAAATLCFVDVFKELTLTLVLRPFDFETLATRIYRFTDEGRVAEAAVPGMALVVLCLVGLFPLSTLMKRFEE